MMSTESFAQRLATEISPADTTLADLTFDAYLEGGASRADLFDTRQPHGAFSGEVITALLPVALDALKVAATIMVPILTADNVGKLLDCIKAWLQAGSKIEPPTVEAETSALDTEGSPEWTQSQLLIVLTTMEGRLREHGLDAAQAEYVALRTLKTLLQEPNGGAEIAAQLAAAPADAASK